MSSDLISRHIFLFPFKWENATPTSSEKAPLSGFADRTNLSDFATILKLSDPETSSSRFSWKAPAFNLSTPAEYNEFNYFYDYVREVLYDLDSSKLKLPNMGKSLLKHYQLDVKEGDTLTYNISVKGNEAGTPYTLDVDDILLNVYDTGVGVLSFFLGNRLAHQADPETILRINQYGRRLAPPFFAIEPEIVGMPAAKAKENAEWGLSKGLDQTQRKELAESISLVLTPNAEPASEKEPSKLPQTFKEDFSQYRKEKSFQTGPFLLPRFISELFPPNTIETQEAAWRNEGTPNGNPAKVFIKPVLDDRMFVLSWYGGIEHLEVSHRQAQIQKHTLKQEFDLLDSRRVEGDFLFRFIFVDGASMSTFNNGFADRLLQQNTYHRWTPYTYFGVSRYSLVCLSNSLKNLRDPRVDAAFVPQHLETLYFKLFELCIIQRASVLRFADEVTHLSHFTQEDLTPEQLFEQLGPKVSELYKNYIRFVNKIYFREITAQDQGIELYDMLQRELRIEEQVEDLDKEIAELHQYVGMLSREVVETREKARTEATQRKLNTLSILASVIGLPGIILTLYSTEFYKNWFELTQVRENPTWLVIIIAGLAGISLATLLALGLLLPEEKRENKKKQKNHLITRLVGGILAVLLTIGMLIMPFTSQPDSGEPTGKKQIPFQSLPTDHISPDREDTLSTQHSLSIQPMPTSSDSTATNKNEIPKP